MQLPVMLGLTIPPGLIIIAIVLFIIGRWVVNQVRESNARARKQAGLENPGQEGLGNLGQGPGPQAGMGMQTGMGMQSGGSQQPDGAARERARQMYAERAEALRAQKMARNSGAAPGGGQTTHTPPAKQPQPPQPQAPAQARMQEPRPLPTQTARNLPSNQTTQTIPGPKTAQQPVSRPQPVKRPAAQPQRAQAVQKPVVAAGLPQSYEREHDEAQDRQRARVAQAGSPQGGQGQRADARRDPVTTVANITRTVSAMDLRRAVMMREILDPPVSLREGYSPSPQQA